MKYAVLYTSETGNTKTLAEEIFVTLPEGEKTIVDIGETIDIPPADMYFIGFGVRNQTYPLKIFDVLEKIENAEIVVFATCGLPPTEKYKEEIKKGLRAWINESCEFSELFVCQGKTSYQQQLKFRISYPERSEELDKIFEEGENHPDDNDLEALGNFIEKIIL